MEFSSTLLSQDFNYYILHYGYIGIYIFFVTIDQLAPIPEEVTLITIGYLSAIGLLNPFLAALFAIAAFFTIDVIYFYLTKHGSRIVKKMRSSAQKPGMKTYKEKLHKHLFKTILILSFFPRVRLFTPVLAALAEVKFKKFLSYSMISLAAFCAVYIPIGYFFSKSIGTLLKGATATEHYVFFGIMLVLTVVLSIVAFRKFR